MIIQHPDGTYELCPQAPAMLRRLHRIIQHGQTLFVALRQFTRTHLPMAAPTSAASCGCGDGGACA